MVSGTNNSDTPFVNVQETQTVQMANLYRVLTMCQKIIYSLQQYSEAGAFILFILRFRKLRLRDMK